MNWDLLIAAEKSVRLDSLTLIIINKAYPAVYNFSPKVLMTSKKPGNVAEMEVITPWIKKIVSRRYRAGRVVMQNSERPM